MKLFYCTILLVLLCQSILLHAGEVIIDPPVTGSDMLCPFKIEVYPKEFQAGDIVYVRLNFENTTDHPVWAPALPLNGLAIEHGILSYYFGDRQGNEYVWKRYYRGELIGLGGWEKILPGQKGLTQHEMIEYGRTRNLKCWDEIKANRTRGQLIVRLYFTGFSSRKINPPIPPVIVVFPSLDIRPRPQKEMEFIENFMSNKRYLAMGHVILTMSGYSANNPGKTITVAEIQETVIEMQEFCDQISQGTLKNSIQYQIFLLELILQIKDKNATEQMKTMEKIGKWLEPLPELEQENLKIIARHLKERLNGQKNSEKLMERFTDIFGEFPPMPEELLMK
jgi:hypothetical protein